MDKIIEEVFKVFNLLAREIQIYFFSGVVVAVNILLIDYIYYDSTLLNFIQESNLMFLCLIVIYLLGQFCMAFYNTVMVRMKFEKRISSFMWFKDDLNLDKQSLPYIYEKNVQLYTHFIDSYLIQILVRCTIFSACVINIISNVSIEIFRGFRWQVSLSVGVFTLGAITFFCIASAIETDLQKSLNSITKNDSKEEDNIDNG